MRHKSISSFLNHRPACASAQTEQRHSYCTFQNISTETKLFNFHRIFKNRGRGGGSSEPPGPHSDSPLILIPDNPIILLKVSTHFLLVPCTYLHTFNAGRAYYCQLNRVSDSIIGTRALHKLL